MERSLGSLVNNTESPFGSYLKYIFSCELLYCY